MRERLAALALVLAAGGAAAEPDAPRRAALEHLLAHDCGSCHGMTLKGGLGPPLTATALADRTDEALEIVIALGRPGTPMPPWQTLLTEDEISWLVDALKDGRFER